MWAMTVATDCNRSQPTSARAASVAMPRPCQGRPKTQATSATCPPAPVLMVAWTVPARQRGAGSSITQLHQDTAGSGGPASQRW